MNKINEYKTVEEVEMARCHSCATSGHWGWCDQPGVICAYKDRIKEILNIPSDQFSVSFEDDLKRILGG